MLCPTLLNTHTHTHTPIHHHNSPTHQLLIQPHTPYPTPPYPTPHILHPLSYTPILPHPHIHNRSSAALPCYIISPYPPLTAHLHNLTPYNTPIPSSQSHTSTPSYTYKHTTPLHKSTPLLILPRRVSTHYKEYYSKYSYRVIP